jgi:hypothetical protein
MSSIAYDPPLVVAISNEEYAERRDRLGALLEERGIDALFVPRSSDLEY